MNWLWPVSYFLGGVFAANASLTYVAGTMDRPFQSPFAKPPGKGLSSPTVNVLRGFFNAVVGYMLIARVVSFHLSIRRLQAMSSYSAWARCSSGHFGASLRPVPWRKQTRGQQACQQTRARMKNPVAGTFRFLKALKVGAIVAAVPVPNAFELVWKRFAGPERRFLPQRASVKL